MSRAVDPFFRAIVTIAAVVTGACTRPSPPSVTDASDTRDALPRELDAGAATDAAVVEAGARDAGGLWSDDDCEAPLEPKSAKSIGHTSVVFKLELANKKKVVFKPRSKKGANRYKGEVAAFRLAGLLALPNVVPACARTIPKRALETALAGHEDAKQLFAEQVVADGENVRGATILWVEGLSFLAFEKEPLAGEFRSWLKKGTTIPAEKSDLARETSTMIVFDYLTGNWDRLSGGNVGMDGAKVMLLYIDNDGAFFETPPKEGLARNQKLLEGTDRFSKKLVERLRTIDEVALRSAFGNDSDGKPLLAPSIVASVGRRLKEVLAHVDARIALHGEAEILSFR